MTPVSATTLPSTPTLPVVPAIEAALKLPARPQFPNYADNYQSMQTAQASCSAQGGTFSITGCDIPPPPPPQVYEPYKAVYAVPAYGNTYDWGECTWYAASRRNVPSDWGNAGNWLYAAQASGWATGYTPRVGAIAWTGAGYYGHVAIVEAVSSEGVEVSEMNYNGGVGIVNYRWTNASDWSYIY